MFLVAATLLIPIPCLSIRLMGITRYNLDLLAQAEVPQLPH
jgi:hypothetical protein